MKKLAIIIFSLLTFTTFAQTSTIYKSKAATYFDKGDFTKAATNLTLALKINPKDEKALGNRALCYEKLQKFDLALKDNLELLKYNKSGEILGSIGYDYLWLDKYDEARKYLNQAIELLPEKVVYRYNLALTYQYEDNFEEAVVYYDEALTVSPKHAPSLISKTRCLLKSKLFENASAVVDSFFADQRFDVEMIILRGDIKKQKGKIEDALNDYNRALAILPEDTEVLNKTLKCLYELGFHEEEIQLRKREIELLLKSEVSKEGKALSYALLGFAQEAALYYEDALESYNESLKLDPTGGEGRIYYIRSILKAKLKDYEGACIDLAKTKEIDPGKDEEYDQFFIDDEGFADFVEYCMPNLQ
jgi:tetratricopeptide (TPR) repeat protein